MNTWKSRPCEDRGRGCSDAATMNAKRCQKQPDKGQRVPYSLQRECSPGAILMSDAGLQNCMRIKFHCFDPPSAWSFVTAALGMHTMTDPVHWHLTAIMAPVFLSASCCFLSPKTVAQTTGSSLLASLPTFSLTLSKPTCISVRRQEELLKTHTKD